MGISEKLIEQTYDALFGGRVRPEPREPVSEEQVEKAADRLFEDGDPFAPYSTKGGRKYSAQKRQNDILREALDEHEPKPVTSSKVEEAYTRMFS